MASNIETAFAREQNVKNGLSLVKGKRSHPPSFTGDKEFGHALPREMGTKKEIVLLLLVVSAYLINRKIMHSQVAHCVRIYFRLIECSSQDETRRPTCTIR